MIPRCTESVQTPIRMTCIYMYFFQPGITKQSLRPAVNSFHHEILPHTCTKQRHLQFATNVKEGLGRFHFEIISNWDVIHTIPNCCGKTLTKSWRVYIIYTLMFYIDRKLHKFYTCPNVIGYSSHSQLVGLFDPLRVLTYLFKLDNW